MRLLRYARNDTGHGSPCERLHICESQRSLRLRGEKKIFSNRQEEEGGD